MAHNRIGYQTPFYLKIWYENNRLWLSNAEVRALALCNNFNLANVAHLTTLVCE